MILAKSYLVEKKKKNLFGKKWLLIQNACWYLDALPVSYFIDTTLQVTFDPGGRASLGLTFLTLRNNKTKDEFSRLYLKKLATAERPHNYRKEIKITSFCFFCETPAAKINFSLASCCSSLPHALRYCLILGSFTDHWVVLIIYTIKDVYRAYSVHRVSPQNFHYSEAASFPENMQAGYFFWRYL